MSNRNVFGKKYVIVGGVAAGMSAAARIRRLDETAVIKVFDKGSDISFSNCCLPNYFSDEVKNVEDLVFFNERTIKKMYNIDAKTRSEVIKINEKGHYVTVKNLDTNEKTKETYDYLIIASGARAVVPKIRRLDETKAFTMKNVEDVRRLDAHFKNSKAKDVVILGAGFIGIEMAEVLRKSGKNVTVIDSKDQILSPYDYDLVQILHKELYDNGVELLLEKTVSKIEDNKIFLKDKTSISYDAIILAVGVTPEVSFAVKSLVEIGTTGGIKVDNNYKTNLEDVYAVGDCIETHHFITNKKVRLALAGPAQKQARKVANAIFGKEVKNKGVIGSSCIRVFGMNAASTGLNEKECVLNDIEYEVSYIIPPERVGLLGANPIHFKLLYEKNTGKVLGAQAISRGESVIRAIDVIATVISFGGDIYDLSDLELCYAPPFSTAKDVVNMASLPAINILNGVYKQVPVTSVRELVENEEYILDIRGPQAFEKAHIKGAVNIPIYEIRDRYEEIPRDRKVYIHCRTSWNSYYAICTLQGLGFDNIVNIQGSFLGLSYFEYFNDKTKKREPILTDYDFT